MIRALLLAALTLALGAAERPFTVVCFGDSITGHRPGEASLAHYLKWSDLLELMLEARLGLDRAVVHNAGYAGDKTYPSGDRPGAASRVQAEVVARAPDLAVVLIGGNDAGDAAMSERTATHLAAVFDALSAEGIPTLVLLYHVLEPAAGEGDGAKVWHHLDDNNALIAELATVRSHAILAMDPPLEAARAELGFASLVAPDGVHLKPGGELVYARTIFAELERLGWIP